MKKSSTGNLALFAGLVSVVIGGIAFTLNWNVWGGGMPGYRIFLFPGNFVLSMVTEEIDFWPKLLLQLTGQFVVITAAAAALETFFKKVRGDTYP